MSEGDPARALNVVSDEVLVHRAVDGDTSAFEEIVHRYGGVLRAYTRRIVGVLSEADDVTQDTFITAWRSLPQLRDRSSLRGWLLKIASREAFAHLRRRRSEVPIEWVPDEPARLDGPDETAVRNEQLRALSAALDAAPEDLRQCWLLRQIGELSYSEIAQEMGVPQATVRGKLVRARAHITAHMEGWR